MGADPNKPELNAVLADVDALSKSTGAKIDGSKLYKDMEALYGKDGGGNDPLKNTTFQADLALVNQKMQADKVLPGLTVVGEDAGAIYFQNTNKNNQLTYVGASDLAGPYFDPKTQAQVDPGFTRATGFPTPADGSASPAPQPKMDATPQPGQKPQSDATPPPAPRTQTGSTPPADGSTVQYGPNGRTYTKNADNSMTYTLRDQTGHGNDTVWWAAKDYLRGVTGATDVKDQDVEAKVHSIYTANKQGDESYADFLKRAKHMKAGDTLKIPTDDQPRNQTPASGDTLHHSAQAKTAQDNADGSKVGLDANGKAVEILYPDGKTNSVATRDANGKVTSLTDYNGNTYATTDGTKWTATDKNNQPIPDTAAGPITSVDMDTHGNVIISRGTAQATTIETTDQTTVTTDAAGKPIEADLSDGKTKMTVQRDANENVTSATDASGNVYTKNAQGTFDVKDSTGKAIADPATGKATNIDMDATGTITVNRTGKAYDTLNDDGTVTNYPDYDDSKQTGDATVKTKKFNGTSQVVEVDYPNGSHAFANRSADGSLASFTDRNGKTLTKDGSGNWVDAAKPETDPAKIITNIDVGADGTVTYTHGSKEKNVFTPDGNAKFYDAKNNLVAANNNGVSMGFDDKQRITMERGSNGFITQFGYDASGAINQISISPDGQSLNSILSKAADNKYHAKFASGETIFAAAPTVDPNTGDWTITQDNGTKMLIHADGTLGQ